MRGRGCEGCALRWEAMREDLDEEEERKGRKRSVEATPGTLTLDARPAWAAVSRAASRVATAAMALPYYRTVPC